MLRMSAGLSYYFCYIFLLSLWHRMFLNFYFLRICFYSHPADSNKQLTDK